MNPSVESPPKPSLPFALKIVLALVALLLLLILVIAIWRVGVIWSTRAAL